MKTNNELEIISTRSQCDMLTRRLEATKVRKQSQLFSMNKKIEAHIYDMLALPDQMKLVEVSLLALRDAFDSIPYSNLKLDFELKINLLENKQRRLLLKAEKLNADELFEKQFRGYELELEIKAIDVLIEKLRVRKVELKKAPKLAA